MDRTIQLSNATAIYAYVMGSTDLTASTVAALEAEVGCRSWHLAAAWQHPRTSIATAAPHPDP